MSDKTQHWAGMHRIWALQGEPLRPPAEAVRRVVDLAGSCAAGRTLILGVTPEFHAAFDTVVGLDLHEGMIAVVWPGDTATKRAIRGDWLTDIPALGAFDLCVGDVSASQLPGLPEARRLYRAVGAALAPGGRLVMRTLCRPEAAVTEEVIRDSIRQPGFSFHALRILIGLHLAQVRGPSFPASAILEVFDRVFPDRADFLARTGLTAEMLVLVDHYATSVQGWYVPDRAETLAAAAETGLPVRLVPSGDYPMAEHMPTLVAGV